jgi:hypothetical protein
MNLSGGGVVECTEASQKDLGLRDVADKETDPHNTAKYTSTLIACPENVQCM